MSRKVIDLTEQKFGRLKAIARSYPNGKGGQPKWLCKCECGKEEIIFGTNLRNGHTKSCGCLPRQRNNNNLIDLIGKRFGRLIVVKRAGSDSRGNAKWLCRCDCGTEKIIRGQSLREGDTKSCGCLQKEIVRESGKKNRIAVGLASMRALVIAYKNSAKRRGYEFNLTEEQFKEITQKDCYYCGARPNGVLKHRHNNGDYIYNGLDRINNRKGYIIDNVVPCCKQCNFAKNSLTLKEFKNWIERIYKKTLRG